MSKLKPCKDIENELLESLWYDLMMMYHRNAAMADNGIPFRMRVLEFVKAWNTRAVDVDRIREVIEDIGCYSGRIDKIVQAIAKELSK